MDKLDTEILNEIQWTFPLVAKPFDEIAKKFEISSDEVKEKLIQLKRKGVLRQLSAIFTQENWVTLAHWLRWKLNLTSWNTLRTKSIGIQV